MAVTRIVWFLKVAPTRLGGLEIFTARMAAMHPSVHFTFCFTGDPPETVRKTFPANATFAKLVDQTSFTYSSILAVRKVLRDARPDLVVYTLSGALRPLPWLAKLAGARVVYRDATSRVQNFRAAGIKGALQRFLTKPISLVIAASEYTRQAGIAENLLSCPSVTVPNGIDPDRDLVTGAEFRAKWGVPAGARLVTQCSWLVPDKGVDLFLTAAQKLSSPDTWFLVAGEGANRKEYEAMAEGLNVIFTGDIKDPQAEGLYAASDIFCLPSRWQEACGFVNIEAMAAGVPVIASRRGGIPEFVADGVAGLLIEPDADELTAKIALLLDDEDLRRRLGAGARQRAHDHFTVRIMAEGYSAALGLSELQDRG